MISRIQQKLKNQKGLTLVELLAVVVILGIIAAIAVPAIGNIIENQKREAHKANIIMVENAVKLYRASEGITKDEPHLVHLNAATGSPIVPAYLNEVPKDPFTNVAYKTATFKVVDGKVEVNLSSPDIIYEKK